MLYKEILSFVAIVLTLAAYIPYIRAIFSGTIKPHVFSWVIWGATTLLAFLAQLEANGGVGAWPIGVSMYLGLDPQSERLIIFRIQNLCCFSAYSQCVICW